MADYHQDFDSHLEDDLSYMYDLDSDYSSRRSVYRGAVDHEEDKSGEETKALLLKLINDNKVQHFMTISGDQASSTRRKVL